MLIQFTIPGYSLGSWVYTKAPLHMVKKKNLSAIAELSSHCIITPFQFPIFTPDWMLIYSPLPIY
jgi:hypothetical protein